MPLIETIGSGSAKAFGLTGVKAVDGLSAGTAAPSAVYLYNTLGYRTNGSYWLNPTGTNPFQAWCIMDRDGGGWVKVLQYNNNTSLNTSSSVNDNGLWTTREINLAAGKLRTADIDALHTNKTTILMRQQSGLAGSHRYWRFRVGSTISGHFPRMGRLGLTVNNSSTKSNGTDYDIYVAAPDNCADNGAIPGDGTVYSYDFGSAVEVTGSYFYSVYNGGNRASTCHVEWSDNNSSWTTAWSGPISNHGNQCGLLRFGISNFDALWSWGSGTAKYVENTNMPSWGTDRDPTGYTLLTDPSSSGNYLYSRAYGNDPQGRCGHAASQFQWSSDHNYTNDAICWSFQPGWFGSNLHWMGGAGGGSSYAYAGGEKYFGNSSSNSMAVYLK